MVKKYIFLITAIILICFNTACSHNVEISSAPEFSVPIMPVIVDMTVSGAGFRIGQPYPKPYLARVAGGQDLSPQIVWTPVLGAQSYDITITDDAALPRTYWFLANIPNDNFLVPLGASSHTLPLKSAELPNSFQHYGQYIGPNPHGFIPFKHIIITVYATNMETIPFFTIEQFTTRMNDTLLGKGSITIPI